LAGREFYTAFVMATPVIRIETWSGHARGVDGSFDKFAPSATGKRGTAAVAAMFLKEIEEWRLKLARNHQVVVC
jgi:hypothetical protein